ncbi:MAG: glycosyltransferase family 39 protein [Chloroflexi bacterium]|nr:glycosyltransferase family 39 protein [Chloroflexota bacterium]
MQASFTADRPTARPSLGARWRTAITYSALLAILALALWLRWDRLDYMEFTQDQAWPISRAYEWVANGDFPLHGYVTSVGGMNGPIEAWLLALPIALSHDPRMATAFVGLLQVLAIAGTFFLGRRYFGTTAGLVAALAFAVNPWALEYSRKIWTPDILPLLSVLFFTAVFAAVVRNKQWHYSLAILWFVVLFLGHPSTVVYAPILLLAMIVGWRRFGPRPLLLGTALGLLTAAPYLYSDSLWGFGSLQAYLKVGPNSSSFDLESLKYILTMATARYFPIMMGFGLRGDWVLPDLAIQNDITLWLMLTGLGICVCQVAIHLWHKRKFDDAAKKYGLILLWFVVPLGVSLRHANEFYPHYFIAIYPLQFILIGITLAVPGQILNRVGRPTWQYLQWAGAGLLGLLVMYLSFSNVIFFRTYLDYIVSNGPQGPYGTPLLYSRRAMDTAVDLSQRFGGERVYVYSYLQRQALEYLAWDRLDLRFVEPPDAMLVPNSPAAGALFILASDELGGRDYHLLDSNSPMVSRLLTMGCREVEGAAVRGPDGHDYYRFFQMPAGGAAAVLDKFTHLKDGPSLANGLRLDAYSLSPAAPPGESATVALAWSQLETVKSDETQYVNLFSHLVDSQGTEIASSDTELFEYSRLQPDEVLLSFHQVGVPPTAGPALAWFDVGAYNRLNRKELSWLDGQGKPRKEPVKIGPIKIAPPRLASQPANTAGFKFGDSLRLLGFDVLPQQATAGQEMAVTLRWRALARLATDYAVSVQMLDSSGKLLAQHDSPPVGGNYPTSYWTENEEIVDSHPIVVPPTAAPGPYRMIIVVYASDSKQRLTAVGDDGAAADHATLGEITMVKVP